MVVDLASRVDGIVESISVDRGDLVETDQVLVKLDSGVEQAAVAEARSRATASAELKASKVSVQFAQRRRDRLEALFLDKAVSRDQLDEISTEADLTRLQLQQAEENQRIAQLELRQSLEILERHTIRSPIDGVVVARYLSPGESTEDQPILRVAKIDPLRVEVIVPVAAFGLIEVGQAAIVSPEAPKQGDYPATVTIVDRVADAASGTFRVRLSMPNPDYELPSGLNCIVRFLPKNTLHDARLAAVSPGAATDALPASRPTADGVAHQCRTVGPFSDESAADRVLEVLRTRVDVVNKQITQRAIEDGFVVVSEKQPSVADARALANRMQAAGIADVFVFERGESAGLVSLGVYRDEQNALRRQRRLSNQGFQTELRSLESSGSEFWLEVELPVAPKSDMLSSDPALAGVSITAVSCDELYAARD
jgi:RND family efflux transporter MFP subunit